MAVEDLLFTSFHILFTELESDTPMHVYDVFIFCFAFNHGTPRGFACYLIQLFFFAVYGAIWGRGAQGVVGEEGHMGGGVQNEALDL